MHDVRHIGFTADGSILQQTPKDTATDISQRLGGKAKPGSRINTKHAMMTGNIPSRLQVLDHQAGTAFASVGGC